MRRKRVKVFLVICVAAFLTVGCSSNDGQGNNNLDEPPFDLPLPHTVTGNANEFEQGLETSAPNSWDIEAYTIDDNVNNTLDYYRGNLVGWEESDYSRDQLKSFTFHRLEFTGDEGVVTIGATDLEDETYLAIIGDSDQQ